MASSGPRAPLEDIEFANEWPPPNADLDNTRAAHSTITSANVATLGVAWTIPLKGAGANGRDVANPVVANGVAYLQGGTGYENFDRPDPFKGDIDLNALEASRGRAGGPRRLAD